MMKVVLILILSVTTSISSACEIGINSAREMIQSDGTVADEKVFLEAATIALYKCAEQAEGNDDLFAVAALGEHSCRVSAAQGQSDMYLGYCLLKVADVINWVVAK